MDEMISIYDSYVKNGIDDISDGMFYIIYFEVYFLLISI